MKRPFGRWIVPAMLALFVCVLAGHVLSVADVGNFNSYDSGSYNSGSSDSGSSSWSSDSSSSSWSNSYSGSSSSYSSSGGGGDMGGVASLVITFLVVGCILAFVISKQKGAPKAGHTPPETLPDHTREITSAIVQVDEAFSAEQFLAFAKETFITLQRAWMERDWEKVRLFEKDTLYQQHAQQLKEYIDLGRINVIERINISHAHLFRYLRDSQLEHLTVYMRVRMIDYIIDEKTREVLKGRPDVDCHLQYKLTFERRKGVKTAASNDQAQTIACPHCGAPTKVTSSGKCEYCDFLVSTADYSWVLADLSGVSAADVQSGGVTISE